MLIYIHLNNNKGKGYEGQSSKEKQKCCSTIRGRWGQGWCCIDLASHQCSLETGPHRHAICGLSLFSSPTGFSSGYLGSPLSHKQTFQIQIRSGKVGSITNHCSGNEPAPNQRKSSLSGKCLKLFVGTSKNDPCILSILPKSNTLGSQTFLAINFREEFRLTVNPQQRGEARPWPLILLLYNKVKTLTVFSSSTTSPLPWKFFIPV